MTTQEKIDSLRECIDDSIEAEMDYRRMGDNINADEAIALAKMARRQLADLVQP